jgi:hypothetical protein
VTGGPRPKGRPPSCVIHGRFRIERVGMNSNSDMPLAAVQYFERRLNFDPAYAGYLFSWLFGIVTGGHPSLISASFFGSFRIGAASAALAEAAQIAKQPIILVADADGARESDSFGSHPSPERHLADASEHAADFARGDQIVVSRLADAQGLEGA